MNKPDIKALIQRTDEHHIERHDYFLRFKEQNKIDLLFIGDSLTRRWQEVPHLWEAYFSKYNPANFGVGCDTIQNLKWRMLNGELEGISPKITVLLIGTNNLPMYSAEEVALGIEELVNILQKKLTEPKIVLMGLLPRDSDDKCDDYLSIIDDINKRLLNLAKVHNLIFFDIGKMLIDEKNKVNRNILNDGIHMIEPGYKIWGENICPVIEENFKNKF